MPKAPAGRVAYIIRSQYCSPRTERDPGRAGALGFRANSGLAWRHSPRLPRARARKRGAARTVATCLQPRRFWHPPGLPRDAEGQPVALHACIYWRGVAWGVRSRGACPARASRHGMVGRSARRYYYKKSSTERLIKLSVLNIIIYSFGLTTVC